jgi:hypothetical protein
MGHRSGTRKEQRNCKLRQRRWGAAKHSMSLLVAKAAMVAKAPIPLENNLLHLQDRLESHGTLRGNSQPSPGRPFVSRKGDKVERTGLHTKVKDSQSFTPVRPTHANSMKT